MTFLNMRLTIIDICICCEDEYFIISIAFQRKNVKF